MKKIYVKPVIEVEILEENDILAGSDPLKYGNAQANYSDEVENEDIDAVDGDFSDAKGSFAFYDSWEEEMW